MTAAYRTPVNPKVVWEGTCEGQPAIIRVVVKGDGTVACEISFGMDAMDQARWEDVPSGWSAMALREVARALVMRS